jgi:hypothetical protein
VEWASSTVGSNRNLLLNLWAAVRNAAGVPAAVGDLGDPVAANTRPEKGAPFALDGGKAETLLLLGRRVEKALAATSKEAFKNLFNFLFWDISDVLICRKKIILPVVKDLLKCFIK